MTTPTRNSLIMTSLHHFTRCSYHVSCVMEYFLVSNIFITSGECWKETKNQGLRSERGFTWEDHSQPRHADSDKEVASLPWQEQLLLQRAACDGQTGGDILRHSLPRHRNLRALLCLRLSLPLRQHHSRNTGGRSGPFHIRSFKSAEDFIFWPWDHTEVTTESR